MLKKCIDNYIVVFLNETDINEASKNKPYNKLCLADYSFEEECLYNADIIVYVDVYSSRIFRIIKNNTEMIIALKIILTGLEDTDHGNLLKINQKLSELENVENEKRILNDKMREMHDKIHSIKMDLKALNYGG